MPKEKQSFTIYSDPLTHAVQMKADVNGTNSSPEYFIEGYASTTGIDKVNDFVTDSCLKDMESQILNKSIKIGLEHDVMIQKNMTLLPHAKIIEGKFDGKGLYIKAKINSAHPQFDTVWKSISEGFLDAFSIEYKPTDYSFVPGSDGKQIRLLNKVLLAGVGLTGRPINEDCRIVDFFKKSLADDELELILHSEGAPHQAPLQEVKNMAEEKVEVKNEAPAPAIEVKAVEPKVEAKAEAKPLEVKAKAEELEKKGLSEDLKLELKSIIKEELKNMHPVEKEFTSNPLEKKAAEAIPPKFETPKVDMSMKSMIESKFGSPRM